MGSARLRGLLSRHIMLVVTGTLVAVAVPPLAAQAAARSVKAAASPCSSGLVALTFDDGPNSTLTPDFLNLLHERHVPATFFVVGQRVSAAPGVVRRAAALGFTIGNHTYGHEDLVRLGSGEVRSTLRRTRRAIRAASVTPSQLMRPPYGSIDARVRAVVGDLGLVPVLWTADPRDWDGRSAGSIVRSVLGQLRPGEPNIVLLHDGVDRSAATLAAVPRIIAGIRNRGYCLAALDGRGRPRPPVPTARVSDASVSERPGGSVLRFSVGLSRPTSRRTSVRVRTAAGTASAGADFVPTDTRVFIPVGVRRAVVRVRVRDDARDEPIERLRVRLDEPRGLRIGDGTGVGLVRDDDPPPRLRVESVEVVEPAAGGVDVPVRLALTRASGKTVEVSVSAVADSAGPDDYVPTTRRVRFRPGEVSALFTVRVLADDVEEPVESFTVRAVDGSNLDLTGAVGAVTVVPPTAPAPPTTPPAPVE